ncbi:hypothetical protein D9M68_946500 [compost metagenome]
MERLDHAAAIDVAAYMLDRVEGHRDMRRIVHGQDDAGDDLDTQAHHQDRAESPPVVEVLWRREVHQVLFGEPDDRQAFVEPLLDGGPGRVSRMF